MKAMQEALAEQEGTQGRSVEATKIRFCAKDD
jgi:hypothetical protein